ncbi:hypothetical protein NDU88_004433 [Pleurodeles waltl]|uniref:Uncharacterized protein n=1 Tax=Pleurodeles waltl TaxID=8319 RepID=A0AAV7VKB7_PLEWA|nr:hypothetical protein NDU88_004433 [Pleurodeles waltl]
MRRPAAGERRPGRHEQDSPEEIISEPCRGNGGSTRAWRGLRRAPQTLSLSPTPQSSLLGGAKTTARKSGQAGSRQRSCALGDCGPLCQEATPCPSSATWQGGSYPALSHGVRPSRWTRHSVNKNDTRCALGGFLPRTVSVE